MIEKIDNTSQIIRDAQDKAMHTIIKYSTPKTIASLMQLMLSMICLIGIQIVTYSFDFSILLTVAFWLKLSCSVLGIILLFRAVVSLRQSSTERRPNVIEARNKYIELNNKKKLDLKLFLVEFNLKTKTETFVSLYNNKIYKVEEKLRKTRKPKKIKKLEAKIDHLKKYTSVEYLNENIERIHIKYNEIFWTDFNDVDVYGESNGELQTRGTANYNKNFTHATFRNMWMYILTSMMLAIGMPTPNEGGIITYSTTICLTLLIIVVRIAQAVLSADRIYDATITRSYIDRSSILLQYLDWQKNNPTSTEYQKQLADEKKKIEEEAQAKWKEHYKGEAEKLIKDSIEKMRGV